MYEAVSCRRTIVPATAAVSAGECEKVKLRVRDRLVEELLAQYASRSPSLISEVEWRPSSSYLVDPIPCKNVQVKSVQYAIVYFDDILPELYSRLLGQGVAILCQNIG